MTMFVNLTEPTVAVNLSVTNEPVSLSAEFAMVQQAIVPRTLTGSLPKKLTKLVGFETGVPLAMPARIMDVLAYGERPTLLMAVTVNV
jgi:hypothetical protein